MKILKIRDNNRMVRFRNRKIRTPAEIVLTENELTQMRTTLKMAEIENFEIIDPSEIKEEDVEESEQEYVTIEDQPQEHRPLKPTSVSKVHKKEESKSLLDKFMKDEDSE
jgi:hypothetical protein